MPADGRCTGRRRRSAQPADNGRMKVFNLRCSLDHRFEGWFASEEDYLSQLDRGLADLSDVR